MSTSVSHLAPAFLAILLGATVVVAAPACGDDSSSGTGGGSGTGGHEEDGEDEDGEGELGDVVYEGGATDEALEDLLAGSAVSDPAETASFAQPTADAVLPAAAPATFSWAIPAGGSFFELPRPGADPTGARAPGAIERAATAALGVLLSGIPEAHAHGDPVNGRAYFVVFATSADPKLLRVFTTQTTYTPDDAAWTQLKSAGAPITATLTSAVFESNRVGADGGPFSGGSVTFTIE